MTINRRLFEILPGILSWLTLILMIIFSWQFPAAVAVFIILFDTYWLLKTIYLSAHLHSGYRLMKKNLAADWSERLKAVRWENIYHLIILPMHNEPYEVVAETFESLMKNRYPKDKFIIILATEERAGSSAAAVASQIRRKFEKEFFRLLITRHPVGLPGEIPGKGANSAWAAKEGRGLIDELKIPLEKVLVSVFDVDTQVFPDYFNCLTWNFLTCEHPQRSSFQPVPFFTNNIFQTSALARVVAFSSTFWQMVLQARPDRLVTFSSHSMPLKALVEIGYWQTNVVSEDSRIFWQCFLHYGGDWRVVPLLYPVSMDANVAPSFWRTMVNIYKQQRRWAYGAENIAFILGGFIKNKTLPIRKKIFWAWNQIEGFHAWATHSLIIFALGWLPILLGGKAFNYTLLSYQLPQVTRDIMMIASVGIATSAILSLVLLPKKPEWFRPYHYLGYLAQWLLTPVVLIIFGCFPAIEAQTRLMLGGKFRLGFWVTPKSRNN